MRENEYLQLANMLDFNRRMTRDVVTVPYKMVLPLLNKSGVVDRAAAHILARLTNLFWNDTHGLEDKLVGLSVLPWGIEVRNTHRSFSLRCGQHLVHHLRPHIMMTSGRVLGSVEPQLVFEILLPVPMSRDPMKLAKWYYAWGRQELPEPLELS